MTDPFIIVCVCVAVLTCWNVNLSMRLGRVEKFASQNTDCVITIMRWVTQQDEREVGRIYDVSDLKIREGLDRVQ